MDPSYIDAAFAEFEVVPGVYWTSRDAPHRNVLVRCFHGDDGMTRLTIEARDGTAAQLAFRPGDLAKIAAAPQSL